jgi:predicted amidohydrolase YtcJ
VSQPSFVYERGDRYLELVPVERHDALYAFRTLRNAGAEVAASSDAPVTKPEPLASVAAGSSRLTASGRPVAPDEAVSVEEGLSWWTAAAARSAFLEGERGGIQPGRRADLVLLPAEALSATPDRLRSMAVNRIWLGGRELDLDSM